MADLQLRYGQGQVKLEIPEKNIGEVVQPRKQQATKNIAGSLRQTLEKPIDITTQIYEPDAVVVLDPTLVDAIDVTSGLKKGGNVIINTIKKASEFNFPSEKVYTVNATDIAVRNGLGTQTNPIVNTAILGAYSKVVGNVSIEKILEAIDANAPAKKEENKKAEGTS